MTKQAPSTSPTEASVEDISKMPREHLEKQSHATLMDYAYKMLIHRRELESRVIAAAVEVEKVKLSVKMAEAANKLAKMKLDSRSR